MHKTIAFISLLILFFVQYRLIYNTYELKDREYQLQEKSIINEAYSSAIRNDKIFPGGQVIIDRYLKGNILTLEKLYKTDRVLFEKERQLICDSLLNALRQSSTMDSLFHSIIEQHQLEENLHYLLVVDNIGITFNGTDYITLYSKQSSKKDKSNSTNIIISGDLTNTNKQNLVSSITVSAPSAYSNKISFSLYVDKNNRRLAIIEQMLPTFLLSILSMTSIVGIFLVTYNNWLKQKKLAEMKSDFLNSITHEFNTPLSTIFVANKSLQNKDINAKSENIQSLTEVIQRQASRLQLLIGQALDITSLHKETVVTQKYDLHPLLEEIAYDYNLKAEDHVNILFKETSPSTVISLNKFSFTTMIYNIMDNALKYNLSSQKEIWITTYEEGSYIVISIRDNGIGMDKVTTKRILEKFYRGKHENVRAAGLGLGLFYVKECLEAHGWRLEIKSEEDVGSEFIIFIPKSN
ncbi:sensor histidine kinase [Olivibacter sitiensis]|uniref:sensor histidine kinase n=1 Tax=Olivibacter sitiensis TaxID=376470 RepID=UPI00040427D1|nr:HAMP domain-containing sensor histidine kinase [Olivibacter sitiensis]